MRRKRKLRLTADKVALVAVLGLLFAFIIWRESGVWEQERDARWGGDCMAKMLHLVGAAGDYAGDHGGRLPPARDWCDRLRPYLKDAKAFVCPATRNQRCSYAYNARLSGVPLDSIREPHVVVFFFESDRGWNAAGGPELLPAQPRHQGARIDGWAFADGHVKGGTRDLAKAPEHWQPQPQAAGKGSR